MFLRIARSKVKGILGYPFVIKTMCLFIYFYYLCIYGKAIFIYPKPTVSPSRTIFLNQGSLTRLVAIHFQSQIFYMHWKDIWRSTPRRKRDKVNLFVDFINARKKLAMQKLIGIWYKKVISTWMLHQHKDFSRIEKTFRKFLNFIKTYALMYQHHSKKRKVFWIWTVQLSICSFWFFRKKTALTDAMGESTFLDIRSRIYKCTVYFRW